MTAALAPAELAPEEIRHILDTAASLKEISARPIKKVPTLRGKTVVTLFYEAMGWEPKEGAPTRGKLAELNLFWLEEYIKDKRAGR